jgi:hypothetical protein
MVHPASRFAGNVPAGGMGFKWGDWGESSLRAILAIVIACDKREAFAQGSVGDEAIHSFPGRYGLLRSARNDDGCRLTP